ncbi:MAG: hypothetical protein QOI88_1408 [Gammaproteobacteria bacterium]|jgi:hypothetical protein|nr:hypothetical protein [Gammaproteobacteria bacterium]
MDINIPEVVAEVTEAALAYDHALVVNDLDTVDSLFWISPLTLRYGPNGTLIGHAAISAYRRSRKAQGADRTLRPPLVTTFGTDFAVTNTESDRAGTITRQSQTWARMPEGWRIVSAHVSDGPRRS